MPPEAWCVPNFTLTSHILKKDYEWFISVRKNTDRKLVGREGGGNNFGFASFYNATAISNVFLWLCLLVCRVLTVRAGSRPDIGDSLVSSSTVYSEQGVGTSSNGEGFLEEQNSASNSKPHVGGTTKGVVPKWFKGTGKYRSFSYWNISKAKSVWPWYAPWGWDYQPALKSTFGTLLFSERWYGIRRPLQQH